MIYITVTLIITIIAIFQTYHAMALDEENEVLKKVIADLIKELPSKHIDTAELIREADENELY